MLRLTYDPTELGFVLLHVVFSVLHPVIHMPRIARSGWTSVLRLQDICYAVNRQARLFDL